MDYRVKRKEYMKKIILTNLMVIIVLFSILEITSYYFLKIDAESYLKPYNENAKKTGTEQLTQSYAPVEVFNQNTFKFRPDIVGDNKKNSILFFGCSYIYGFQLEENETLPYFINKETNLTTINRGIPGGSILSTLYDLNDNKFYEEIKKYPTPKYIIYLYINDHLTRIRNPYRSSVRPKNSPHYQINPEFKIENGQIIENVPNKLKLFLYSLYTTKAYHYFYAQNFKQKDGIDEFFDLMYQAKKITDEKFPKSKFVILLYKDGSHFTMHENIIKKLTDNGFIVLDTEKLAGHELETDKWRSGDKEHPNAKAFEDISKGLVKELNLLN